MKLKSIGFMLLLISMVTLVKTENAKAQAGNSAVPFLLISPDARASGMGEVGTAIADDINAVYWNPGGLGFLDYFPSYNAYGEDEYIPYRQVALSFSPWLPQFNADLFYSYGTYAQFFEELDGTLAFNFVFMNLGEFTRTAENGEVLGKFNSNEFAAGLSYGTIVARDLGLGINLRYIQSNLTPTGSANQDAGIGRSFAFDIGLLWKPIMPDIFGGNIDDRFNIGLNLKNVGPQITYINEADPLPTSLRLGTAIKLFRDEFNELTFAADFAKLLVRRDEDGPDPVPISFVTAWENPGAEFSTGLEYWYQNVFAFRIGYFTEPAVIGNRQYYNFGAGVRYDIFNLDFSFINTVEENHPLANTMRFSLIVNWE